MASKPDLDAKFVRTSHPPSGSLFTSRLVVRTITKFTTAKLLSTDSNKLMIVGGQEPKLSGLTKTSSQGNGRSVPFAFKTKDDESNVAYCSEGQTESPFAHPL